MARSPRVADLQLLVASGITGVAGAAFVLVSERAVGLEAFAPMAQLWTIWSISSASLLFAFQQWAIRMGIGRHRGLIRALRGGPVGLAAAATIGTGLVTLAIRDNLFHRSSLFWPALAALVVLGTVACGVVRGELAATGRHGVLALVIGAENVIRIAMAVVFVGLGAGVAWYALALPAGYAILAVAMLGRPPLAAPSPGPGRHLDEGTSVDASPASATAGTDTLGTAAIAGFLSHVALAGPPLLLAVNGGSARTVSTLFVLLTAIRLPHLVLQAGAPRAGVMFHHWLDEGRHDRLNQAKLFILGGTSGLAVVAFGAGVLLGDILIGTLFDIRGRLDPVSYGLMAAAGVLSVGDAFATVLLVARGANRYLVTCWLLALSVAVAVGIGLDLTEIRPTAVGLVILHLVALVLLTAGPRGPIGARTTTAATGTTTQIRR